MKNWKSTHFVIYMRYTDMKEMRHEDEWETPSRTTHKKYNVFEGKLIAGDFDTSFDVLLFFLSLCATMRAYIYENQA